MAEKNDHQWFQELNLERINLGSGKRVMVDEGVFNKKYQITVPKEYADNLYQKQAELLLRILPSVMREDVFALKVGTAINFFWRDYPVYLLILI